MHLLDRAHREGILVDADQVQELARERKHEVSIVHIEKRMNFPASCLRRDSGYEFEGDRLRSIRFGHHCHAS